MKKLVSFSLFVTIILLALIAKNTTHAQPILPATVEVGPGWKDGPRLEK